jgi:hypothetical protein
VMFQCVLARLERFKVSVRSRSPRRLQWFRAFSLASKISTFSCVLARVRDFNVSVRSIARRGLQHFCALSLASKTSAFPFALARVDDFNISPRALLLASNTLMHPFSVFSPTVLASHIFSLNVGRLKPGRSESVNLNRGCKRKWLP